MAATAIAKKKKIMEINEVTLARNTMKAPLPELHRIWKVTKRNLLQAKALKLREEEKPFIAKMKEI